MLIGGNKLFDMHETRVVLRVTIPRVLRQSALQITMSC
jgi:hypothetical protein